MKTLYDHVLLELPTEKRTKYKDLWPQRVPVWG